MQHTEEELRAIYYAYYDRLPEPVRSEARERWDYLFAKYYDIPNTIPQAINHGFNWDVNGEWYKWDRLFNRIAGCAIPLSPKFDEAKFQSLVSKDHPPIINRLVEEQNFIDCVKKDFYEQFKELDRKDEVWEYFEIFINPKKQ